MFPFDDIIMFCPGGDELNSLWLDDTRHMVSDILANIGSGNGLSPVWHQAITSANVDLLPIKP